MNIKELREVFSHNKPIYKNLSQFSKIYFYLRDIGESLRGHISRIAFFFVGMVLK
jgi:hypothetical protein